MGRLTRPPLPAPPTDPFDFVPPFLFFRTVVPRPRYAENDLFVLDLLGFPRLFKV